MDLTYYIFAFYIFLLVCGIIWIYNRMKKTNKKKDNSNFEKEQRLYQLYQNVEDMLGSFEEYAEESKMQIDERLKKAEQLMQTIQSEMNNGHKSTIKISDATRPEQSSKAEAKTQKKESKVSSEEPKTRIEDIIPQLIAKGLDKNEIAKALGISSREVSLIMELKNIEIP